MSWDSEKTKAPFRAALCDVAKLKTRQDALWRVIPSNRAILTRASACQAPPVPVYSRLTAIVAGDVDRRVAWAGKPP